ncbi:sulfotransferase 1C1-like [Amphiura filiformis]|uniref:sulfotransferase 1C1-like n=1 Tax=Amphiura filiformis TaxID=82378 RepID=UPI003B21E201
MEEVLGAETVEKIIHDGGLLQSPPGGKPKMYECEGVLLVEHHVKSSTMEALKTWQARQDDAFVVSYPKAGTTWTQEIVSAIVNEGDLEQINKSHTAFRVPYLEATFLSSTKEIHVPPTHEIVDKMKSPRTIKSHLPGHILPPDAMRKKARIVYVARNPKDLAVSFFYFRMSNPSIPQDAKGWNAFFEDFYAGKIVYGSWWNHYLYYWNLRHEPNVLFLKFEDMKKDLKGTVERIADFLGYTFSDDVIGRIVSHCTFGNMKANPMTNPDTLFAKVIEAKLRNMKIGAEEIADNNDNVAPKNRPSFMRKGKVGDWKSHFTVAQNEAMDELIREKLAGSGLVFDC